MIVELLAPMGGGKTILSTYFGLNAHLRGVPVYCNYKLKGFGLPFDTIMDIKKCTHGLCIIDDIISWFDSRTSAKNYKASWFYTQSRKRGGEKGIDIVYSSQVDTGADYRLRELTDCIIETSELKFPYFNLKFTDANGYPVGQKTIRYGTDVSEIYDTYEIVEQTIRLSEILALWVECQSRNVFGLLCSTRWNLTGEVGKALHELFRVQKLDLAKELLIGHGYKLEDDRIIG